MVSLGGIPAATRAGHGPVSLFVCAARPPTLRVGEFFLLHSVAHTGGLFFSISMNPLSENDISLLFYMCFPWLTTEIKHLFVFFLLQLARRSATPACKLLEGCGLLGTWNAGLGRGIVLQLDCTT